MNRLATIAGLALVCAFGCGSSAGSGGGSGGKAAGPPRAPGVTLVALDHKLEPDFAARELAITAYTSSSGQRGWFTVTRAGSSTFLREVRDPGTDPWIKIRIPFAELEQGATYQLDYSERDGKFDRWADVVFDGTPPALPRNYLGFTVGGATVELDPCPPASCDGKATVRADGTSLAVSLAPAEGTEVTVDGHRAVMGSNNLQPVVIAFDVRDRLGARAPGDFLMVPFSAHVAGKQPYDGNLKIPVGEVFAMLASAAHGHLAFPDDPPRPAKRRVVRPDRLSGVAALRDIDALLLVREEQVDVEPTCRYRGEDGNEYAIVRTKFVYTLDLVDRRTGDTLKHEVLQGKPEGCPRTAWINLDAPNRKYFPAAGVDEAITAMMK